MTTGDLLSTTSRTRRIEASKKQIADKTAENEALDTEIVALETEKKPIAKKYEKLQKTIAELPEKIKSAEEDVKKAIDELGDQKEILTRGEAFEEAKENYTKQADRAKDVIKVSADDFVSPESLSMIREGDSVQIYLRQWDINPKVGDKQNFSSSENSIEAATYEVAGGKLRFRALTFTDASKTQIKDVYYFKLARYKYELTESEWDGRKFSIGELTHYECVSTCMIGDAPEFRVLRELRKGTAKMSTK